MSLSLQYNISPQSSEVPKSRSLERKQQDPIVLTKWRHSTYVLDLNDKVRHDKDSMIKNPRTNVVTQTVRSDWCGNGHVASGLSITCLIGSEFNPRVLMRLLDQQGKKAYGGLICLF